MRWEDCLNRDLAGVGRKGKRERGMGEWRRVMEMAVKWEL